MASLQLQRNAHSSTQAVKKVGVKAVRCIKPATAPEKADLQSAPASDDSDTSVPRPRARLPGLPKAPHFKGKPFKQLLREHSLAAIGEFFGTATFIGLSIAGVCSCNYNVATAQGLPYQDASKGYSATSYQYIATSNGLTALVTIWICFRISGAFFNPAISLANYLAGTCNLTRTLVLLVSQLVGGIAGTAVTYGLFPSHCNASPALSPNTSLAQGVFIEMFITSFLVFSALYGFRQRTKATFLSPILIGLVVFSNILAAGPFTSAAQNPVRALAPAVIRGSFNSYHWVYWVGPLLGGLLGSLMYRSVSYLHKNLPSGNEIADTTMEEAEHLTYKAQVKQEERETANGERIISKTQTPVAANTTESRERAPKRPQRIPSAAPAAAADIWGDEDDMDRAEHRQLDEPEEPGFYPVQSPNEQRTTKISAYYEDENGERVPSPPSGGEATTEPV